MTDIHADPTRTEDIVDEDRDVPSAQLERQADAILLEAEAGGGGPRPLRRAVGEDAALVRAWGRKRAARLRGAVENEPVRATLYALGLGVIVGLLAAR